MFSKPAAPQPQKSWPERFEALAREAKNPLLKRFYKSGCVSADTPLSKVPMIAIDFETTGLDPTQHSIVSVGMVPFTLKSIELAEAHHWIVRPRQPLSQASIEVHGITHSDIDHAPDIEDILPTMFKLMNGRIAVVHFRAIEREFLDVALQYRFGEGITFPVIDTMAIEAHLHPDRRPTRWQQFFGKKPVSIRLADSRIRYRLPHYPSHNALVDALATAELLQAQILHHFSPETPIGDLWL
ncbi:3'-5' exonuclease [Marinobacter sp. chi1]|uniref:3'-5' exonuclease n=1 Tax=Marinobacter suaedae TaxID=3057675 RepID=A0ABT8W063_9GAMM|nr:3'-5' exonuclease [Marinobacter sp. chi1]MDO3721553.1 3'-5' exonuclease [Marinobacter sp. chi1]